jgi:hypothetical protein
MNGPGENKNRYPFQGIAVFKLAKRKTKRQAIELDNNSQ